MEELKIRSVSQAQVTNLNAATYGQSGTGKTIFAAGFPKPILFIDTDKGTLSLKVSDIVKDKDKIHVVEINDLDVGNVAPQGFDKVDNVLQSLAGGEFNGIKPRTLVIDSLTTTSQMCLAKAQFLNGHLGQQPTLPDYGGQRRYLEKIIKTGVGLDMHFLVVCHEDYYKDENTGRLWLTPMVVGKLARELPLYFDEVYHAAPVVSDKGVTEYKMETSASGLITAKSRLGLNGSVVMSFETIRPLLEKAQGQVPEPEKGGQKDVKETGGSSVASSLNID